MQCQDQIDSVHQVAALAQCSLLQLTHLSVDPDGIAQVSAALQRPDCVVSALVIKSLRISKTDAISLAQALRANTSLRTLEVWFSMLDGDGAIALAAALLVNRTLETLELRGNAVHVSGISRVQLHPQLHFHAEGVLHTVRTLIVRGSDAFLSDDARIFAGLLHMDTRLEVLELGNMGLQAEDGALLADAMQSNTLLKTLKLDDNELDDVSAEHFAMALRWNRTLQVLDLNHNNIQASGTMQLLVGLDRNASLQKLDLRCNHEQDTRITEILVEAKGAIRRDVALLSVLLRRRRDLAELNEAIVRHILRLVCLHIKSEVLL